MQNTKSHLILASTFLLLIAAPACFADLMCYVCDDCLNVSKDTPLLACNEEYFNQGGSTEASTVTTTTASTILPTTETETVTSTVAPETTTAIPSDPTSPTTVDTTTPEQTTTEITQSTESTEAPIPTPATVGPPETTTSVPTPPNTDLISGVTRLSPVDTSRSDSASEFPIRQRRSVINTDVSFHCYTVQKTINNTVQTARGCSKVAADQSVCKELELQNVDIPLAKCDPCSMNACNSATSMLQSPILATLLVALVAALLQKN